MEEARSLFRNKDTTEFVIVTIPTAMAAAESGRLAKARDCAVLPAELSAALPTSGAAVPGQGLLAHPRRRVGHCASRSPAVAPQHLHRLRTRRQRQPAGQGGGNNLTSTHAPNREWVRVLRF